MRLAAAGSSGTRRFTRGGAIAASAFLSLSFMTSCTAGGISASSGNAGGATYTVNVDLTLNQPTGTPYGESGGMKPPVLNVMVGDTIAFMNADSFAHTSSSLGNFTAFPNGSPLTAKAVTQRGSTLSGGWTSGAMQAGTSSQIVLADQPGTYLYGCYFHYGAPMRGAIVAR
jgi:plastocyanin